MFLKRLIHSPQKSFSGTFCIKLFFSLFRQQQGGQSVHRQFGGATRLHQGSRGHHLPFQHQGVTGKVRATSKKNIQVVMQE